MAPVFPWSSGSRTMTSREGGRRLRRRGAGGREQEERDRGGRPIGGSPGTCSHGSDYVHRSEGIPPSRRSVFPGCRLWRRGSKRPPGSELADQAREVRHRPWGDARHQVELAFIRRKEEALEDEAALRADGEGGVVPEDDTERPVRTECRGCPRPGVSSRAAGIGFSPRVMGGVPRCGSHHADRPRRRRSDRGQPLGRGTPAGARRSRRSSSFAPPGIPGVRLHYLYPSPPGSVNDSDGIGFVS